MTTANDIDEQKLLHYLTSIKVDNCCGGHEDFQEWNNETEVLRNSLIKIGKISTIPSENQSDIKYWGANAPIQMDKYPYYDCEIFQCKECNTVFFFYIELGGHGPQKRYRVVKKELIDVETIKPKHQIIIDIKDYEYIIYKNPDLSYGISICKSLGVGVDIYHQLTFNEQNSYLQNGISTLKERMKDMDTNYNNYKVTSWR